MILLERRQNVDEINEFELNKYHEKELLFVDHRLLT